MEPQVFYYVEDAEPIERYTDGGYHPIQLGDLLHDRYKIVHKLGFGSFSTVWLARDEPENRFVAVKVAKASSHELSFESEASKMLVAARQNLQGAEYVARMLDSFTHLGPNGCHPCFVSVAGGSSLSYCLEDAEYFHHFTVEVARTLSAQMIMAVTFVHSQGIVHGDLHLGNFLTTMPALEFKDYQQFEKDQFPVREPVRRLDGAPLSPSIPPYLVLPRAFGPAAHEMSIVDARIMLSDFGEAWAPSTRKRFSLHAPLVKLPPENMFAAQEQRPIGFSADIWSLAVVIYEVYATETLFSAIHQDQSDLLAETICAIGRPPQTWWDLWADKALYFNDKGEWDVKPPRRPFSVDKSLEKRVAIIRDERGRFGDRFDRDVFGDEEMGDFVAMLERMLRWNPEDRITSDELVRVAWMRNWGLPAIDKMKTALREPSTK